LLIERSITPDLLPLAFTPIPIDTDTLRTDRSVRQNPLDPFNFSMNTSDVSGVNDTTGSIEPVNADNPKARQDVQTALEASGPCPDPFLKARQEVQSAFEASGLSLAAFAEAYPNQIEKLMLPNRPMDSSLIYPIREYGPRIKTDQDLINQNLRLYHNVLSNDPHLRPGMRLNLEFLVNHYENGGSLPPRGTQRTVRGGRFFPGGFSISAAANGEDQQEDIGWDTNCNQFVA